VGPLVFPFQYGFCPPFAGPPPPPYFREYVILQIPRGVNRLCFFQWSDRQASGRLPARQGLCHPRLPAGFPPYCWALPELAAFSGGLKNRRWAHLFKAAPDGALGRRALLRGPGPSLAPALGRPRAGAGKSVPWPRGFPSPPGPPAGTTPTGGG